jgi:hypothetical protein
LTYAGQTNGHIKKHLELHHPTFLLQLQNCKNNLENFRVLETNINKMGEVARKKLEKNQKGKLKFDKLIDSGLSEHVKSNFIMLAWGITNLISRYSLNCPIFDLFLKSLGAQPAPNRSDLALLYLLQLDALVRLENESDLKNCFSVSASCDGWRARIRHAFMSITLGRTTEKESKNGKVWAVGAICADIIYIPGSATADNLETAVLASLNEMVWFHLTLF